MPECRAERTGDRLVLENACIRRQFAWNEGHLISQELHDLQSGRSWLRAGSAPDVAIPGATEAPVDGQLSVEEQAETSVVPAHLQVDVKSRIGQLEVLRRFRLYPGCPAIACDLYLRGVAPAAWLDSALAPRLATVEPQAAAAAGKLAGPVADRLPLAHRHVRLQAVQFFDVSDWRNTFLFETSILPYRSEAPLTGNLLLVRDVFSDEGLFVLKEAPCSFDQLAWPGCDFVAKVGDLKVIGIGLEPGDVAAGEWTRGYGTVVGVAPGGEYGLLRALHAYQARSRVMRPGRDHMVLLNTWGDRGQDTKISESFALAEIERASRLGISHFQLDDGWQAGQSSNSAAPGGSLDGIWDRAGFWAPHAERFPNGLSPVVERGRELGVEVCLWFNPSKDASYAHWQDDADTLISLNHQYGIRTFKIDGVVVRDKAADHNLRAMFDRVVAATRGEAVFNIDVTNGRRWGYHYGAEYGNIFVENRYTDVGNYYPHWTLRNLWMLSRYVSAQKLQMEFLNKWRNAEQYPANDPLAPQRMSFDYCFAVTMAAQPLAWFEATGLPEEAFAIAPLVHTYRAHQERIHAGVILPLGEEPTGAAWTGFQSIGAGEGYLIVYREGTPRQRARIRLWGLAGQTLRQESLGGSGVEQTLTVDSCGEATFSLPEPFSFAFYQYHS